MLIKLRSKAYACLVANVYLKKTWISQNLKNFYFIYQIDGETSPKMYIFTQIMEIDRVRQMENLECSFVMID